MSKINVDKEEEIKKLKQEIEFLRDIMELDIKYFNPTESEKIVLEFLEKKINQLIRKLILLQS